MKILFLTQIVPYPPDAGPKVKTWHVLRYLVKAGHQVTLVTYVRKEEEEYLRVLQKMLPAVHAVPMRRSFIREPFFFLRSLLRGRPWLIERDDLASMRATVRSLMDGQHFDVIHADQLGMAQFAFPGRSMNKRFGHGETTLVFDAHNAVYTILTRSAETSGLLMKLILMREAPAVRKYEAHLLASFDHTLAVTNQDRDALFSAYQREFPKSAHNPNIPVIPIAVDTRALQPVNRDPNSYNIVTLGTLHYPPNADGIRWFTREVFPLIQDKYAGVTLTIIGKNPPADFLQLASESNGKIKVTGYVPDLTPYLEESAVMVVPVRAGGGMRVRILEAFARAMPVVTTTVGLEGIDAVHGQEVWVADQPQDFANGVVKILNDPILAEKLANRGRKLAEIRYDWQAVLSLMDLVYSPASEPILEKPV